MEAGGKRDLRDLTHEETRAFVEELGCERFRADQIFRWVHGRAIDAVDGMTDLGKALRARVAEHAEVRKLDVDLEQISRDGTRKLRLRTADARVLETVLIPDGDASAPDDDEEDEAAAPEPEHLQHALFPKRPKLTQCVSSQVGCALDCTFCATAKLGFGRNLTAGEIVDQVYRAQALVRGLDDGDPTRRAGADHVTNIVFMGMGEPLHNYANVMRALAILTDERGAGFSRRRITVSTAGLVPAIEKLAREQLQPNLAVSLNATTDEVRDQIMPINRKWNIARLLEAVRAVPLERRRRITFEYVLLDGVNDTDADAARLAKLIRGIPSKVNVIPWNPHPLSDFRRPSDERVRAFQSELKSRGLAVYVRRSRGDDIDAACGQLAAKAAPPVVQLRT
ncbi:MAG TPA: 23S rRNA (adenine(2503)-C(2))-methyltransferase RlmN [Polyangia bacterium]|nr:23S rRNA (adenine(2503)-C(2))-methyltransferase RlmN [Polyangia bacterium]